MMGSLSRETQGQRSHLLVISKKKKKKLVGFGEQRAKEIQTPSGCRLCDSWGQILGECAGAGAKPATGEHGPAPLPCGRVVEVS